MNAYIITKEEDKEILGFEDELKLYGVDFELGKAINRPKDPRMFDLWARQIIDTEFSKIVTSDVVILDVRGMSEFESSIFIGLLLGSNSSSRTTYVIGSDELDKLVKISQPFEFKHELHCKSVFDLKVSELPQYLLDSVVIEEDLNTRLLPEHITILAWLFARGTRVKIKGDKRKIENPFIKYLLRS